MYNVLVCDDERDIVSALKIYLTAEGYQVYEAYNGKEALEVLSKEEIHLVLMDIMMPVMDGIETLVKIKEYDEEAKIIMVTASGQKNKMLDAIKLGAADFVTKPYETSQIISIMDSMKE